jgi:glyoxylase-like metal-dependent hydrolase (beta-lactamase superfamily II)
MRVAKSSPCAAMIVAGLVTGHGCALAEARPKAEPLELNVYTADEPEFYVTATLVHGRTEALLVDTRFHDQAVEKLVSDVAATNLTLKAIFITHPDGDHYGGMAAFKARFPDTPIYMTQRALQEFKRTVNPSKHLPVPESLPRPQMSIDGQVVDFVEDLQGDYAPVPANTLVWVPSLRTVISDDIVFRGVHPWLTDSTPETRAAWLQSLQRIGSLHPKRLIPGHEHGLESNSPSDDLKFMVQYITTFDSVAKTAPDAPAFISEMKERFPTLAEPLLLEYGAKSVYPQKPP